MGSFKSYNVLSGEFSVSLYSTIYKDGDYKILSPLPNNKSYKPIEIAHSSNSIYAILKKDKSIQSIQIFDGNNKKSHQIDFTHFHNKIKPHTHDFTNLNERYHPKDGRECTKEELEIIEKIKKIIKEHM